MKTVASIVREVLARHARREAGSIDSSLDLRRDLHLRPLELALVSIELEEIAGIPLSCLKIASFDTVGELAAFLSTAVASARPSQDGEVPAHHFARLTEE